MGSDEGMTQGRSKKGFTLVEVIAVAVILALLAAFAAPGMKNFIIRSQQSARDNVARTVFLAAQSALTNRNYENAAYLTSLSATETVDLSQINPASSISAQELADNNNPKNIHSLVINPGDSSSVLYDLIEPYINDKAILLDAILVEFNITNGNVLAAFYSEKATSLSHGASGYNVYNRARDSLVQNLVGYYGVEATGKKIIPTPPDNVTVALVDYVDPNAENYGLLTAECTLPAALSDNYTYTLSLEPQNGAAETITIGAAASQDADLQLSAVKAVLSAKAAMEHPLIDRKNRTIPAYWDGSKIVFILDSAVPERQMTELYAGIGCGYLSATFTASDGVDSATGYSNLEHAYFSDKKDNNDGTSYYEITSVRHLNNIRNQLAGAYKQAADVYVWNYSGAANKALLAFIPVGDADKPFTGTYLSLTNNGGTSYCGIYDLTVNGANVENAGLFGVTSGRISYVRLAYSSAYSGDYINGSKTAGGIAGVNSGSIERCTASGKVNAIQADGIAGGIVGRNLAGGSVTKSNALSTVKAAQFAGGIAGENLSEISYCEVGTDSKVINQAAGLRGVPYYGAYVGPHLYPNGEYAVENNVYHIETTGGAAAAGGIAGNMEGSGQIVWCTNASYIGAAGGGGISGGIVGSVSATTQDSLAVQGSYNAGSVMGGGSAGGVVGTLTKGEIFACYNTGCVNVEVESNEVAADRLKRYIYKYYNVGNAEGNTDPGDQENTVYRFGGIVGYGTADAAVSNCYNMQYVASRYGGAFGVMERGSDVDHTYFMHNIYNNTEKYSRAADDLDRLGDKISFRSSVQLHDDILLLFDSGTYGYYTTALTKVGAYDYTLPYLSPAGLEKEYHRTPWTTTIEETGRVSLTVEPTDATKNKITLRFLLKPEINAADLYLVVNDGNDHIIKITLDAALINELRSGNDVAGGIAGVDLVASATPTRRFAAHGVALTAGTEEHDMGYDMAYYLTLRWQQEGTNIDYLQQDDGAVKLTAKLCATGSSGPNDARKLYAEDSLDRPQPDRVTLVTNIGKPENTWASSVNFGLKTADLTAENLYIRLHFEYRNVGGTVVREQTTAWLPTPLSHSLYPSNANNAINGYNYSQMLELPANQAMDARVHYLPVYIETTGGQTYVRIVMWGGKASSPCVRPNGLYADQAYDPSDANSIWNFRIRVDYRKTTSGNDFESYWSGFYQNKTGGAG